MANNVDETLDELTGMDGFIAAALVDADSGMALGMVGGNDNFDIEVAAAANTEVVQAKLDAADKIGIDGPLQDILITLRDQYHLIRPLEQRPEVFFYVALERDKSNLAMSRMSVGDAADGVEV